MYKTIKSKYGSGIIFCGCSNHINTDLEDDLVDSIELDPFNTHVQGFREYECKNCGMNFKLSLEVEKIIKVSDLSLEEVGHYIYTVGGEVYNMGALKNKYIGDPVPLSDGAYVVNNQEYIIKGQKVSEIWSLPDENQLSLFEEAVLV